MQAVARRSACIVKIRPAIVTPSVTKQSDAHAILRGQEKGLRHDRQNALGIGHPDAFTNSTKSI
jgi:hypothetical protein